MRLTFPYGVLLRPAVDCLDLLDSTELYVKSNGFFAENGLPASRSSLESQLADGCYFGIVSEDAAAVEGIVGLFGLSPVDRCCHLSVTSLRGRLTRAMWRGSVSMLYLAFEGLNMRKVYVEIPGYIEGKLQSLWRHGTEEVRLPGHLYWCGRHWDQSLLVIECRTFRERFCSDPKRG